MSPAVAEEAQTHPSAPVYRASFKAKRRVVSPPVSRPERSTEQTAASSASVMSGRVNGMCMANSSFLSHRMRKKSPVCAVETKR